MSPSVGNLLVQPRIGVVTIMAEEKEVRTRALGCFYLIQEEHLRISLCIPHQGRKLENPTASCPASKKWMRQYQKKKPVGLTFHLK